MDIVRREVTQYGRVRNVAREYMSMELSMERMAEMSRTGNGLRALTVARRWTVKIMPMERERYPADWLKIARAVKDAADWKCQKCGKQCRRPGEPFDTHKRTLTVAHLNHTPEDVRPENLMALCAPCHLKYDAKHHAETRRTKNEGVQGL